MARNAKRKNAAILDILNGKSTKMQHYKKFITGTVVQEFEKQNGVYVCTGQSFEASDQVERESTDGPLTTNDLDEAEMNEVYYPMTIEQPNDNGRLE
jgi:hypothetical protein